MNFPPNRWLFSRYEPWLGCLALHCALLACQACIHSRFYFRNPYFLNSLYLCFTQAALLLPPSGISQRFRPAGRVPVLAVICVVLLGGILRVVEFGEYPGPHGNVVEEVQTGSLASASLTQGLLDPDFPLTDLLAESALDLGGPSMNRMRVPFVLFSIAGVWFFFLASRRLLRSPAVTLGATALYATNAYLAASGRIAMETFAPVATTALALAACFEARNRFTPFSWGLAGIAVGLLWQEYFSYRLVAVGLAGFMALALAQGPPAEALCADRRPLAWSNVRGFRMLFVVFVGMAAAAAGPVIVMNLQRPSPGGLIEGLNRNLPEMLQEGQQQGFMNVAREIATKSWETVEFWFRAPFHDVLAADTGFFDSFGALLVALGFAWCLVSARRAPARFLLAGLPVGAIVLSAALCPVTARYRTLCNLPFLILCLGVLADDLWTRLRGNPIRLLPALVLPIVIAREIARLFESGLYHEGVTSRYIDPVLAMVSEVGRIQRERPDEVVHLVGIPWLRENPVNDYEPLYARDRSRFAASMEVVPPHAFFVLLSDEPVVNQLARRRTGVDATRLIKFQTRQLQILSGRTRR